MKSKIIFLFLITLFTQNLSFAQNKHKIDTLFAEYKTSNDTSRINILNQISHSYLKTSPDSSLKYSQKALIFSKKTIFLNGQANAYELISNYNFRLGNYENSNKYADSALSIYKKIENNNKIAHLLIHKSSFYMTQSEYIKAIELINEAKTYANEKKIALCNYSLATIYFDIENYEKTFEYILLSLEYYEQNNILMYIAHCNNVIGSIYIELEKFDLALEHLNISLKIYKEKRQDMYASTLSNIALTKESEKKYNEAIKMYNESAEILQKLKRIRHLANVYYNLGNIYLTIKNYNKAKEYFIKSKAIYENLKLDKDIAFCLLGLGKNQENTNPTKAINYYEKSLKIAEEYNDLSLLKDVYEALFLHHEKKQNYKLAFDFHKKYLNINDSIFNIEKEKTINNITISYETEKKDQQIQLLNKKNELKLQIINKQKQKFVFLIILLLFFIIFPVLIIILLLQKNSVLNKLVKKDAEVIQAEKQLGMNIRKINAIKESKNSSEKEIATHILKLMEEDKVFTQKDLSVSLFAAYCNTNPKYISQTINNVFEQKFNSFINEYRIKYACQLFLHEKFKNYTISAIADESGFNSMSTFINSFKKNTGVTPSYYLKNIKN